MADEKKNKISDILNVFKNKDAKVKKTPSKVVKPVAKRPVAKKPVVKKSTAGADAKIKAVRDRKAADKAEKAIRGKTHQDLINVAYKAAEELKISPWVLLRAAKWGNFTDDRGKKYDGPMIDDIDTLDDAQKKALKKALNL